MRYPFLSAAPYLSSPGVINSKRFVGDLNKASPLFVRGTPREPVYDYHATGDELAPIGPDRQLVTRYCQAGVHVDHVEIDVGEHLSTVATGAPGALAWLSDRFGGEAVPDTCPTSTRYGG
jgi:hypothetical protein